MNSVFFVLGVIVGIVLSLLIVMLVRRTEAPRARFVSKHLKKGSIIEPESEEVNDWIKEINNETTI